MDRVEQPSKKANIQNSVNMLNAGEKKLPQKLLHKDLNPCKSCGNLLSSNAALCKTCGLDSQPFPKNRAQKSSGNGHG